MHKLPFCICAAALLATSLAGCQSADTIAASRTAEAQADLDQGHLAEARIAIGKAIKARDDVLDTWLLKAHIDVKSGDRASAFNDFESALEMDHGNMEALQSLCQLGITIAPPETLDKYADQLLLLVPDAPSALIAKGMVALAHHDPGAAAGFADRVLAQHSQDLPALALRARILIAQGRFVDAAALIEKTPDTPGETLGKLGLLKDVYTQAHDRAAYDQTIRRMAVAAPGDSEVQLDYADLLYQDGQNELARAAIHRVLVANPADLRVAARALNVWLEAGPAALDGSAMVADAARLSLLMKADYAQFANETGHPAIALAILPGAAQGDASIQNSNAKAAWAYAMGTTGHLPAAMAQLSTILDDFDHNHPWALLARARLLAAAHDYPGAVRDARLLVANDGSNPAAYLALADVLRAGGSADLSESALREGLRAIPTSTRLAARLAATLAQHGARDQAAQVALDLSRTATMDQRAGKLLAAYPPATPPGAAPASGVS